MAFVHAPAASVAVLHQPQIFLPVSTLYLPADGTLPPPPPILPVPSAWKIASAGIAAAHAPEVESITQSLNLSSGHVDDPEPVAPSIELVADPTEDMLTQNMIDHFKREGTRAKPGPSNADYPIDRWGDAGFIGR